MQRSSWDCNGLSRDVIEFKVDKDIVLSGVRLFGSESNLYILDALELYQGSPYSVFESPVRLVKLERSTYPSKLLESCQNFSYHGLEVLFNSNPSLKQNTLYHISVLISGAKSGKGCKGLKSVKIAGVTFTFLTPPTPTRYALGDRNSVEQGQFAEFLFSLPN